MSKAHMDSVMFTRLANGMRVKPDSKGNWRVPVPSDATRVRVTVSDANEVFTTPAQDAHGKAYMFSLSDNGSLPEYVRLEWQTRAGNNVATHNVTFVQTDAQHPDNYLTPMVKRPLPRK